jgi:dTDP-4-dehydrorhamnose reductase
VSDEAALVVGVDGLIGGHLADRLAAAGGRVYGTTRRPGTATATRLHLDLSEDVSQWPVPAGIRVGYLCAGVTSLDVCEREATRTWGINVSETLALAERLIAARAFVIYLSTNAVFDGSLPSRRPEEARSPRSEYGRQRAAVEERLLAGEHPTAVVRFTKILAPTTPLLRRWADALRRGEVIHPFSDAVMSPVSRAFAVLALQRIAAARLTGVWQVSGDRDVTYEDAARHMARRLGAREDLIQPITARAAHIPCAFVPRCTTLDTTRLQAELGLNVPDVWSAIDSAIIEQECQ